MPDPITGAIIAVNMFPGSWGAAAAGLATLHDSSNNGRTNSLLKGLRDQHKLDERVTGLPEDMFQAAQELLEESFRRVK